MNVYVCVSKSLKGPLGSRSCHVTKQNKLNILRKCCQSAFSWKCLWVSLIMNQVKTGITVTNNSVTSPPIPSALLYNPAELSPRQWWPWHSGGVSLQSARDSHIDAWIQDGKCLDKTFMHVHKGLCRPVMSRDSSPHTHHSVMRLGGLPCQDIYCSVSRHWVTMALSTTLYIAGGNAPTHTDNHLRQTVLSAKLSSGWI